MATGVRLGEPPNSFRSAADTLAGPETSPPPRERLLLQVEPGHTPTAARADLYQQEGCCLNGRVL